MTTSLAIPNTGPAGGLHASGRTPATLSHDELTKINSYWRAANYLSVGQIYLYDNPLLREPLTLAHVKPLVVGHWGTTPGQNFIYVHLNRVIKKYDLDMFYIAGPGHGGPALVANTYLEGSLQRDLPKYQPGRSGNEEALHAVLLSRAAFRATSRRRLPGSIHEGGELGYSLSHAFGAAFDNPGLIVACIVGDGEAETGPARHGVALQQAARSDHRRRRAADPTPERLQDQQPHDLLARIDHEELDQFLPRLRLDPILCRREATRRRCTG